MELLCEGATFNYRYLELETDVGLKSRMRENCTYGSVRGSRQAFHVEFMKGVSRLSTRRAQHYVVFVRKFKAISYLKKSYAGGRCGVLRHYATKRFKMGTWGLRYNSDKLKKSL